MRQAPEAPPDARIARRRLSRAPMYQPGIQGAGAMSCPSAHPASRRSSSPPGAGACRLPPTLSARAYVGQLGAGNSQPLDPSGLAVRPRVALQDHELRLQPRLPQFADPRCIRACHIGRRPVDEALPEVPPQFVNARIPDLSDQLDLACAW